VRTKILPGLSGVDLVIRSFPSAYDASFDTLSMEIENLAELLKQPGSGE
jgi:hypothetical protein